MESQQQLIGVSRELGGNFANMQGTTRAIYDSAIGVNNGTIRFFDNVQSRPYPFSNISQNRFETGEALAIESIAIIMTDENIRNDTSMLCGVDATGREILLDLYIGNQRVIKALDLSFARNFLGNTNILSNNAVQYKSVFYLETPIVIPPLIEFYAEIRSSGFLGEPGIETPTVVLILQGTGTLLNTQKNF